MALLPASILFHIKIGTSSENQYKYLHIELIQVTKFFNGTTSNRADFLYNNLFFFKDLGYPPRSSNATIILKPLKVKYPTFKEAYYIGDYYVNNTFVMRSQPELEMAGVYHEMEASFDGRKFLKQITFR